MRGEVVRSQGVCYRVIWDGSAEVAQQRAPVPRSLQNWVWPAVRRFFELRPSKEWSQAEVLEYLEAHRPRNGPPPTRAAVNSAIQYERKFGRVVRTKVGKGAPRVRSRDVLTRYRFVRGRSLKAHTCVGEVVSDGPTNLPLPVQRGDHPHRHKYL